MAVYPYNTRGPPASVVAFTGPSNWGACPISRQNKITHCTANQTSPFLSSTTAIFGVPGSRLSTEQRGRSLAREHSEARPSERTHKDRCVLVFPVHFSTSLEWQG